MYTSRAASATGSFMGHEQSRPLARLSAFIGVFPLVAGIGALILAVLGSSGWLLHADLLTSIIPGMPTMKIVTAVLIGLLGVCLLGSCDADRFRIPVLAFSLITMLGALYFLINPVGEAGAAAVLLPPSEATSLTIALLAFANVLRSSVNTAWPIAVTLVFASLLPLHRLITFVVGHGTLHTTGPFDSMSLPTSIALYLLAGGLFLSRELPYAAQLAANTLQGRLLRLTLPWTLFAPPVLAVLITVGVYWELYDIKFVVAMITAAMSALMTALLWLLTVKLQSTEDKRAEIYRDLSLSERYANQLIEASQDAMVAVDRTGRILRANAQSEKLFGYTAQQLLQMHISELLPERFRKGHGAHLRGFFADPEARAMGKGRDLPALRADGTEVPVEVALTPLDSVYGPIVLANVIDVSDRILKEAQMRASLEEKTLLLNEVHHRVKNNLQIVASLLTLQAGVVQDPTFNGLIAESEGRVRAMALLHQILYERKDFSHVELDIYLRRLTELQMQIHRSMCHSIRLDFDCENLRMELDQAIPLGQVVNELLSNAFKHAFTGLEEGQLSVTLKSEGVGRGRLIVCDNGPGFVPGGEDNAGLGMQLIELLSEQIGAELKFCHPPGGRVELNIPVLAEKAGSRSETDITEQTADVQGVNG